MNIIHMYIHRCNFYLLVKLIKGLLNCYLTEKLVSLDFVSKESNVYNCITTIQFQY